MLRHVSQSHITYLYWNEAVVRYYFNDSQGDRPVYLQVDAEALRIIGQQLGVPSETAENSFIEVVREHIQSNTELFRPSILAAKYLQPTNPTPEFVAVLAFCVLAASRMERDNKVGISAANYYWHLNDLLGRKRQGRPPQFERTAFMWEKLNEWLNVMNQGTRGIATARPLNNAHPYVGYPQSQCLLRATDRQQLPRFFSWARLQSDDTPRTDWLRQVLCSWANHASCSFSRITKQQILQGSSEVIDHIVAMVVLELQAWDGIVPEYVVGKNDQIQRPLLHLRFDRGRRALWRAFPINIGGVKGTLDVPQLLPDGPDWLTQDVQHGGDTVVVFGNHLEYGEWFQQPRIARGYPTVLLAYSTQVADVRSYLAVHAKPGWTETQVEGIPPNWTCFRGVEIISANPRAPWPALRLQDDVVVRLTGGLKLDRGVYLTGFEPTLTIYATDVINTISINKQPLPTHTGGISAIPLTSYCQQPAYHTIMVGTRTRSFITRDVHRPVLPANAVPQLAYRLQHDHGQYYALDDSPVAIQTYPPRTGELYVSGACVYGQPDDLPGPLPHTIFVPNGFKRYIVLGRRPGDVYEYSGYAPRIAGKQSPLIRLNVPFDPQWLIKVSKRKYLSALQPAISAPLATPVSSCAGQQRWSHEILRNWTVNGSSRKKWTSEQLDAMWEQYRRVAQAVKAGLQ